MSNLMIELADTITDARGTFRAWVMAGETGDGRWEGWLEFVPTDRDTDAVYATPIETRQHDRPTVALWASGLTHVYAEGALARATLQGRPPATAPLASTLQELVEVLDRRMPEIERAGETGIAAAANRLRSCAMERLAAAPEDRQRAVGRQRPSGASGR